MSETAGKPAGSLRAWEIAAALLAACLFVALRLPLLTDHGAIRGWNSDAGVFGLASRRIVERGRVDVFFWGQNYMGPLTSLAGAGAALVRHGFDRRPSVDPVSLRLGSMAEVFVGILFFWAGLREAAGRRAAAAALLLLSIGPRYLFDSSVIPHGDEIVLFCSGILFWLAARSLAGRRHPPLFETPGGCLLFGVAAGFGWWMNQGVVFILLPLAVVLLLRSRVWSQIRPLLRPFDRLFLRPERLAWRRLSPLALFALRGWQSLLLLAFLLALLRQAGLPVPAIYVFHPLLEPPALLLLTAALCELRFQGAIVRRAAALALEVVRLLPRGLGFVAGFLVGYLPVAAGRFLGWYSRTYGPQRFDAGVDGLLPHLRDMAKTDLWKWLGADRSSAGIFFFAGCAAGLFLFAWERRARVRAFLTLSAGRFHAAALAGAVVIMALLFYAVALRNGGDPRYIGPAVPAAYALAASGLLGRPSSRFRAGRIGALALLMGCGAWSFRAQDGARIAQIESEVDPRALISRIRSEGYRVCYAGFWEGYKLQFLSEEELRFIPWKTHDRNPAESRPLAALPGPKCLLLPDGTFRAFTEADVPKPIGRR